MPQEPTPTSSHEQIDLMATLVKTHAAAIAALPATEIENDQLFQEIGFDSQMLVGLVNGLEETTGLAIELSVISEHPTPYDLAIYLHGELTQRAKGTTHAPEPTPHDSTSGTIGDLFRQSVEDGRAVDALGFLAATAQLRPRYSGSADAPNPPAPLRLSRGPGDKVLICLESLGPFLGNFTYARFSRMFLGTHDVYVLRYPGYDAPDALPDSPAALGRVLAPVVEGCADGAPFVLVGYCSGGWAARLVAAQLESEGIRPHSIVLIDTPVPDDLPDEVFNGGTASLLASWPDIVSLKYPALTAFGWHYKMLRGRPLPPTTTTPTLSIRATEPFPHTDDVHLNSLWPDSLKCVDVKADHYSIVVEHAEEVARITARWISSGEEIPRTGTAL
ncbi:MULTISPECIES: alpha/beta fold hydrolase [unclassified Streptomyces]|uniref:alpha/beta fold hydrolase n=1 Tax=unclassified Streptomyces TaxID=2593676 RepID=UPI00093B9134|nr:alpha/beta fold hydrolase [Streptomyces sp. TSRI0281]OKI40763.1 hypothetical protein A6A29_38925 [Streptomyces sp. TSRI0281]